MGNTLTVTAAIDSAAPTGVLSISPPVLFFFLGAAAALVRSNIAIPRAVTKLLSLYLLWAIGFRGGVEMSAAGLTAEAVKSLALALILSLITPVVSYAVCRRIVDRWNAAALAACYGSVSVVTFLTACAVLDQRAIPFGGHMVAAMALMEAPAIVIALVLLRREEQRQDGTPDQPAAGARPPRRARAVSLFHEALLNGPVVLLLGSFAIGALTGSRAYAVFKPLCTDVFPGVLAFFLLDLGVLAAKRLPQILRAPLAVPVFALAGPLCFAVLAILTARALQIPRGDAVLLGVLAASASYIAAPAALRLAVPRADPGLYVSFALGVTFPFNIILGIPLYVGLVHWLW